MLGRLELDLTVHPAPSLVIEVNYTSSSVDRMAIYAALGVDEVWCFHRALEFHRLEDGLYQPTDRSLAFPMLTVSECACLLEKIQVMGRVTWMKEFRRHVRDNFIP